ncbi:S-adenosylmethionine--2-demethylmenaquinone methyltransferase [Poseidonibacter parvus]|uniref:4-hydroxy-4-methyl-2-oxoglutarate aldolase n=1 Tax=Poseidonibacter parvus TaxID=1850254 RepID=A0A1P8KJJ7_9BACT|nr:ribonuclease E activity regulator RraA [Poseidonibacter parvus]APW64729.1 S-adenosylmethionine--2-demethylmenaquinone methyltransferase [Poseidonibacter parvus]
MNMQVSDICDDNQNKKIQVLSAKFNNYGKLKKFSGQIETLKISKSNFHLLEILRDEDGKGRIMVVDNNQDFFGVVGDKLMAFALKNNWTAIIINGYVRDTFETKNIDVGLYAIGACPLRNFEKTKSFRGIDLKFEGVSFSKGDYIYADEDGIILTKNKLI